MTHPIEHIRKLCQDFLAGTISARMFSDRVENYWNFGDWGTEFEQSEKARIKSLFDVVVLYSEFEQDNYPGYKNEDEVKLAALHFLCKCAN